MENLYPVLVSYSNIGYLTFATNLLMNLEQNIKNHKVHFYCLDDLIFNELNKMKLSGILTIDLTLERLNVNVTSSFANYGTLDYNKLTHTKVTVLQKALETYNFIHFIDCDVVCIKEPSLEHYHKYSQYDVVFQHDAGFHSKTRMHASILNHIWACTGNMSMRNTAGTKRILAIIDLYQRKYKNKNDQECLYQYMMDHGITNLSNFKDANLFTYPYEEYTNGYWLNKNIGDLSQTYFFHANHVSGSHAKIQLLQKANQWYL